MINNIKKFIELKQEVRKIKEKAEEIDNQTEKFNKEVENKIKLIRKVRAKAYKNSNSGIIREICETTKTHLKYEVSYCGCCGNKEEYVEIELLMMKEKEISDYFEKKQSDYEEQKRKEKVEKDKEDKKIREEFEKKEFKRLKRKYEK